MNKVWLLSPLFLIKGMMRLGTSVTVMKSHSHSTNNIVLNR